MATRSNTIALTVMAEVADGVSGLGSIETAAQGAAREVRDLVDATGDAPAKLDAVTGAADGLDGAMGAATGAMGALGSGLELAGFEGAAENLQKAAMATDFLSGVGQAAKLAVDGQAAATKALTTAQTAANAVMRANPIGLVVTAILLLVAGLALAYNKSETFRDIVQKVGAVAKDAFGDVVDAVSKVVDWVADKVPAAFQLVQKGVALYLTPPKLAFDLIVEVVKDIIRFVGDVPDKFESMKTKAESVGAAILSPFTAVKDAIQSILDLIARIDIPKLPGFLGGGDSRVTATTSSTDVDALYADRTNTRGAAAAAGTTINVTVNQVIGDPVDAARQIRAILARADRIVT